MASNQLPGSRNGLKSLCVSMQAGCEALQKRVHTRARNLMKRGLTEERAWRSAKNQRGPWFNAGASHMNAAFPKSWFDRLGLVSLLDTVQRLQRVT